MSSDSPGSDNRSRLLRIALKLFCEKGYGGVGTNEICTSAGVLKGTLYHFFPSKLELALAALREYGAAIYQGIADLAASNQTPEEKLRGLFRNAHAQALIDREKSSVMFGCLHGNLSLELSAVDPRAREVLEEINRQWVEALSPIVIELADQGKCPADLDPTRAAQAVIAYLHGVVLVSKTANDPEIILQLGENVFHLLGVR